MFESLTERMTQAVRRIRGLHKLTEENMAEALKEVRTALLSADVHFKVARDFIDNVKSDCVGIEVTQSVTPGQQIIKVIHDKLVALLGEGVAELSSERPLKLMLVGLHGAGKTTHTVKLARYLAKQGHKPAVIACDVYRPAAIDQLESLANQENILFYANRSEQRVVKIAEEGLNYAQQEGADIILFDTAGRLQIDTELIDEVKDLAAKVQPQETLLVADSALGQEAVNVAQAFHDAVQLTGIVLTKLDGDARGGAALSMKAITGVPIKFIGTGEKLPDLQVFHPDRMAQRILGMGDVVSLVEQAQEHIDQKVAQRMQERVRKAEFDFEDFLVQLKQINNMGSLGSLAKMLPGAGQLQVGDAEQSKLKRNEAIIQSMTLKERRTPNLINGSRRMRIAKGAGVEVRDVNQLLKEFQMMRKMMKSMKGAKGKKKMQQMMSAMGGPKGGGLPGLGF